MNSPLAGAWLFFHSLGCVLMGFDGRQASGSYLNLPLLAWLLTLGASAFLLAPVVNGAAFMWCLAAMPMLALLMTQRYLKNYLWGFGIVLGIYALVLIGQFALSVDYTFPGMTYHWFSFGNEGLNAAAWPLIDPNNAACVVNFGLIPCFYMALNWKKKPKTFDPIDGSPTLEYYLNCQRISWWIPITMIFAVALVATASKAGIAAAATACAVLTISRYGIMAAIWMLPFTILSIFVWPNIALSFSNRLPIWQAASKLLDLAPLRGVGLGMFGHYYATVRTEHVTGGWFAHNDLLQIAIETGLPAALIFCWQWIEVFSEVCRRNLVAVCVIGAVLVQSMVEFQLYLPSISLLLGLAVAYCKFNFWDEYVGTSKI